MDQILFVVGAGASVDFGLPIGRSLARQICEVLTTELEKSSISGPDGEAIIEMAMESSLSGDYRAAARDVAGGMIAARSIDRFLKSREDRPLTNVIGKCAIASCLLDAERKSNLFSDRDGWTAIQRVLMASEGTWLASIFGHRQDGVRPDDVTNVFKNIRFLTFNYDRCIERYLELAFEQMFQVSRHDAIEIVKQLEITHVYGSLGSMRESDPDYVPFGASRDYLYRSSCSIRTINEGVVEGSVQKIHRLIGDANKIFFFGFGFDPMNVNNLFPKGAPQNCKAVIVSKDVEPTNLAYFKSKTGFVSIATSDRDCKTFCSSRVFLRQV